jgi:hypothetical protein
MIYKQCGNTKYIARLNESVCMKHESNQPHFMQQTSWLSWKWYAQWQESGGSRQPGHVVSFRLVGTNDQMSKQGRGDVDILTWKPWSTSIIHPGEGEKRRRKIKAGREDTTRIRKPALQSTLSPTKQYNKLNWQSVTKHKGKGLPPTNMPCRHSGRAQVGLHLHSFLTSALEGGVWKCNTPTALPPTVEKGGSRQLHKRKNILLSPGFEPWNVQPVASCCTD